MRYGEAMRITGFIRAIVALGISLTGIPFCAFAAPFTDCLAPALHIGRSELQAGYALKDRQLAAEDPLFSRLRIAAGSPVDILLRGLALSPVPGKSGRDDLIPVTIGNARLLGENVNFDPAHYSAYLAVDQGIPLFLYVQSGYHPGESYRWRYFIDFSELTAFDFDKEAKARIEQQVRKMKKDITEQIFSRILPGSYYCSIFSVKGLGIPVLFNVHMPNDVPSDFLVSETEQGLRAGMNILDIGTGSGKIAALLAKAVPVHVVAVDNKKTEVLNARITAAALGLSDRIEVIESDLFTALKGRKFNRMYFYPMTTEQEGKMTVAKFFQTKAGAAEINEQDAKKMFNRLFSQFAQHLTAKGVLYLALMKDNKIAYEKISEYEKKGIISANSVYTGYEKDGTASFEIIAVRPAAGTLKEISAGQDTISTGPQNRPELKRDILDLSKEAI